MLDLKGYDKTVRPQDDQVARRFLSHLNDRSGRIAFGDFALHRNAVVGRLESLEVVPNVFLKLPGTFPLSQLSQVGDLIGPCWDHVQDDQSRTVVASEGVSQGKGALGKLGEVRRVQNGVHLHFADSLY